MKNDHVVVQCHWFQRIQWIQFPNFNSKFKLFAQYSTVFNTKHFLVAIKDFFVYLACLKSQIFRIVFVGNSFETGDFVFSIHFASAFGTIGSYTFQRKRRQGQMLKANSTIFQAKDLRMMLIRAHRCCSLRHTQQHISE
jgi:hypothetical protein